MASGSNRTNRVHLEAPHAGLIPTLPARGRVPSLLVAVLTGLYLVAAVAAYGYFRIFAELAGYDDEGYVMQF